MFLMSFLIFYCKFSEILCLKFWSSTNLPTRLHFYGRIISRNKIIIFKIISKKIVSYIKKNDVDDIKGVMLSLLQNTSATSHNYTTHSSVQHMIIIPSVQTTKFCLRSIKFHHFKNNSLKRTLIKSFFP